jgi:outer membrane receptor for ferrienterochelin and colicin
LLLGDRMLLDVELQPVTTALQEIILAAGKKKNAGYRGQLVIDKDRLSLFTASGKNISDYLFYLPQARMIAGNEGAVSFAGQNNRYNAFFIDGAINNDVFGLAASGTNGGQAGISPVPVESIEQLQVNRSPYDASIGNFTGAGINAITRSGTNRPQASVYHNFSSAKKDYYSNVYGMRMQGPLRLNRCFYFMNIELNRQQYPKFFNPDTYTGALTGNDLSILINSLRANYKYDAGGFLNNPEWLYAARAVARIDWNVNARNSIAISSKSRSHKNIQQYEYTHNDPFK